APVQQPILQEARVVAFHQLEAAVKVRLDPAPDIFQAVRRHATLFAEAAIDRLRVAVAEPFDDHEEHQASSRLNTTDAFVPPKPKEFDSTVLSCASRRSRTIGISANAGSMVSMFALSQMKPLFIISSE